MTDWRPQTEQPTTGAYFTRITPRYDPDCKYSFVYGDTTYELTYTTVSGYDVGGIAFRDEFVTVEGENMDSGAKTDPYTATVSGSDPFSGDFCRFCSVPGSGTHPGVNFGYEPESLREFLEGVGFGDFWSMSCPDSKAAKDFLLSLDSADDPPEGTGNVTGYTIISCPVLGLNGWYLYTTDNGYLIFEIGPAEHCYYVGSGNAGKLSGYFRYT